MPMGQVLLRGIPPDIPPQHTKVTYLYHSATSSNNSINDVTPETTGSIDIMLNAICLRDASTLLTTHSNIADLLFALFRQLFLSGKITKIAYLNLIKYSRSSHSQTDVQTNSQVHQNNMTQTKHSPNLFKTCHLVTTPRNEFPPIINKKIPPYTYPLQIGSPKCNSSVPLTSFPDTTHNPFKVRLLYPHTRLHAQLPPLPPMPVFKNRINHTNTPSRLTHFAREGGRRAPTRKKLYPC